MTELHWLKSRNIRRELDLKINESDKPKIEVLKNEWQKYVDIKLGAPEKHGKTREIIECYWQNQIGGIDMTVAAWLDRPDVFPHKIADTLFRKYGTELEIAMNQLNPIHQEYCDYEATISKQLNATPIRIKNDFKPPLTLHQGVSILVMDVD